MDTETLKRQNALKWQQVTSKFVAQLPENDWIELWEKQYRIPKLLLTNPFSLEGKKYD